MASLQLTILEPAHGTYLAGPGSSRLRGQLTGGSAGLFFKWYSTLNPLATQDHPELNAADHGSAILDWAMPGPLGVGTHVITLAAADREGNDLTSTQAVIRAGFAGGAPAPGNATPCVVHRLWAILNKPPAGAMVSKSSATLEARAPARWAKKVPPGTGPYVKDPDYHALNGIRYRFHFAPAGPADPAKTGSVTPGVDGLTFFIDADLPYVRYQGPLPGNLGTGAYTLTLFVESLDGAVSHSVSRNVTLAA